MTGRSIRPTARGIAVLVVAVLAYVLSRMTALVDPARLAVALAAALVLALLAVALMLTGLRLTRRQSAHDAEVGSSVTGEMTVDASAPLVVLPLGRAVLRERLPGGLGGDGDIAFAPRMRYSFPARARGDHRFGDVSVLVTDPLGLVRGRRHLRVPGRLRVVPRLVALEEELAPRDGRLVGADGRTAPQRSWSAPAEPSPIPRPYAPGDDPRRIHWRASARTGELMTREVEHVPVRSLLVLLDDSAGPGSEGDAATATQDWMCSAVCSVAALAGRRGWETVAALASGTRLGTVDALSASAPADAGLTSVHDLQRTLAEVEFARGDAAAPPRGAHTAVVAVVRARADLPDVLHRIERGTPRASVRLALVGDPGAAEATVARHGGWTVVTAGPQVPLAAAWAALGEAS